MKTIVFNGLRTPDGTILHSTYRHDFVGYIDKNGKKYIIDGGNDYVRRSNNGDEVTITVYSDEPFKRVRRFAFRKGYGELGTSDYGIYRITFLDEMTDGYLLGAIKYLKEIHQTNNNHFKLLMKEAKFRKILK